MKFILSIILLLCSSLSFAAKEPLSEVVEIVELPNFTQKQIFDSAKIWMAQSFKSSNSVIQYEDITTGTIVGKGNMQYPCKGTWNCLAHENYLVFFTVKIDTKDNKARILFNDLKLKIPATVTGTTVIKSMDVDIHVEKDKEIIKNGLIEVIKQFKDSVQKNQVDNNW